MMDLRSDTVTVPTPAMREAMVNAPVGDDVYGEDPTVIELERRTAKLLGHEAGLFCTSGSLANLLGVRLLVEPGQEVVCDVGAHIARAEMGAHAAVHGLTMRTVPSVNGLVDVDAYERVVAPNAGPYLVSTAAVAVENTHNFGGGTIQPYDRLVALGEVCRSAGLGYHLDGARLWNAHVATGVSLEAYGSLFDTVSVCFSKGLGAPVGSVLVSSAANIARARVWRKRLGGGWRQAGILAAGALHALDHHVDRLAEDHRAAAVFAAAVAARCPRPSTWRPCRPTSWCWTPVPCPPPRWPPRPRTEECWSPLWDLGCCARSPTWTSAPRKRGRRARSSARSWSTPDSSSLHPVRRERRSPPRPLGHH